MKIRLERRGVVFEYERQPMKESRFRALCALAAAGVFAFFPSFSSILMIAFAAVAIPIEKIQDFWFFHDIDGCSIFGGGASAMSIDQWRRQPKLRGPLSEWRNTRVRLRN